MAHMYSMMVTRKGQDGSQTTEVLHLSATPMRMRAEAFRQAHTDGTYHVMVAEDGEWVGTTHGVGSPANSHLWWTPSPREAFGMKAQVIDSKGRLEVL